MSKEILNNDIFYCMHLFDVENYDNIIRDFRVEKRTGSGLVTYLKRYAEKEEKEHLARTYLVFDCKTKELVAYFTLKAGGIAVNEKRVLFSSSFDSIAGVELSNFAVNHAYKETHPEFHGIGYILIADFVIPLVKRAAKIVGIKVLYIFSLPYDNLINYYKTLDFVRLPKKQEKSIHRRIKPRYDKRCIFMYQNLEY